MASSLIFQIKAQADTSGLKEIGSSIDSIVSKIQGGPTGSISAGFTNASQGVTGLTTGLKAGTGDVNEFEQGMNKVFDTMGKTTAQTIDAGTQFKTLSQSLSQILPILVGIAAALPLAGFIKGAADAEQATARFALQLHAMGDSISNIDFGKLSEQTAKIGVSQAQLTDALQKNIRFFHSSSDELALLNTAMGIAVSQGISLESAYGKLGLVQQGITRTARQLGVSMRTDIHDPIARAAAVTAELTAKFAPMASGAGSTNEKFSQLGATITNAGNEIGAAFLPVLGSIADTLNKLPGPVKEAAVAVVLVTTAVLGLSAALGALIPLLGTVATGLAVVFGATPIGWILAAAVGIGLAVTALLKYFKGLDDVKKKTEEQARVVKDALAVQLSAADNTINTQEDLKEAIQSTTKEYKQLQIAANAYAHAGVFDYAKQKSAEAEIAKTRLDNLKALEAAMGDLGVKTISEFYGASKRAEEGDYAFKKEILDRKFQLAVNEANLSVEAQKAIMSQYNEDLKKLDDEEIKAEATKAKNIADLQVAIMQDGLDKELAQARANAELERANATEAYQQTLAYRKGLTLKEAQEEADIRIKAQQKGFDDELAYALKTKDEQKQYDSDLAKAQQILANSNIDDIKNMSDANKEILKTEAGKVAIKERETALNDQLKQDATLQAKYSLEQADNADEVALKQAQVMLAYDQQARARLQSSGIDKDGIENANKIVEAQQKVVDILQEANDKKKALHETDKNVTPGQDVNKQLLAKFESHTLVTVNITPNVGELAKTVSGTVEEEVSKKFESFKADLEKRLVRTT